MKIIDDKQEVKNPLNLFIFLWQSNCIDSTTYCPETSEEKV